MQRQTEPELMKEPEQAKAYAMADFDATHNHIVQHFLQHYATRILPENILDLGCGCGDISFRLGRIFPQATIIGIDGATAMLSYAHEQLANMPEDLQQRVHFFERRIPHNIDDEALTQFDYCCIVSNSLLHHLHQPNDLWQTINHLAVKNTVIYICDLFRPPSQDKAKALVKQHMPSAPDILQRDFYRSLLAAFSITEIQQQLIDNNLKHLSVETISDRHVAIHGVF